MKLFFYLCIKFILALVVVAVAGSSNSGNSVGSEGLLKKWKDDDLERLRLEYPKMNQTLVLVHASWCTACRQYLPSFQRQGRQIMLLRPNVNVVEVHYDNDSIELCTRLMVRYLPSVFFIYNGNIWQVDMEKRQRLAIFIAEEEWKGIESEKSNPFDGRKSNLLGWMVRIGNACTKWFNTHINIYAWLFGGLFFMLFILIWSFKSINHDKTE